MLIDSCPSMVFTSNALEVVQHWHAPFNCLFLSPPNSSRKPKCSTNIALTISTLLSKCKCSELQYFNFFWIFLTRNSLTSLTSKIGLHMMMPSNLDRFPSLAHFAPKVSHPARVFLPLFATLISHKLFAVDFKIKRKRSSKLTTFWKFLSSPSIDILVSSAYYCDTAWCFVPLQRKMLLMPPNLSTSLTMKLRSSPTKMKR